MGSSSTPRPSRLRLHRARERAALALEPGALAPRARELDRLGEDPQRRYARRRLRCGALAVGEIDDAVGPPGLEEGVLEDRAEVGPAAAGDLVERAGEGVDAGDLEDRKSTRL